jgi:hypothetical protein
MFQRRGRLRGGASASSESKLRPARRRSLEVTGDRAESHHYIGGLEAMKDRVKGWGIVPTIITTSETSNAKARTESDTCHTVIHRARK